jgi:hypothetical protein
LAIACQQQGIVSGIVSINEKPGEDCKFRVESGVSSWGLSSEKPWAERTAEVKAVIDQFCPDWVSVQFVPYGYHPRGLCWAFIKLLREAVVEPRKQVFFHELFLGLQREESFRNRIVGVAQRFIINQLIREWNPDLVHSHAAPYLAWLRRNHSQVKPLPLIGNIPVVEKPESVAPEFDAWVAKRDQAHEAVLIGGYFGTFYPGGADSQFQIRLRRFASRSGRRVICFLAGRQTTDALARWKALEDSSDENLKWIYLGALEPASVSSYLLKLDFGIAATPWALAGKSGSIAAMREHSLPVLVPRNDWTPRLTVGDLSHDGLIPAWQGDAAMEAVLPPKPRVEPGIQESVVSQFLSDIDEASR